MNDEECQCPRCGRLHKSLGFGTPPASIRDQKSALPSEPEVREMIRDLLEHAEWLEREYHAIRDTGKPDLVAVIVTKAASLLSRLSVGRDALREIADMEGEDGLDDHQFAERALEIANRALKSSAAGEQGREE